LILGGWYWWVFMSCIRYGRFCVYIYIYKIMYVCKYEQPTIVVVVVVFPSSTCSQQVSRLFLFSLDHTQAHTAVGRTPLDEGSARHRNLYLTTPTLYKTNIHAPRGIRTHDPSKRSAADLRLSPRGHWDRHVQLYVTVNRHKQAAVVNMGRGSTLQVINYRVLNVANMEYFSRHLKDRFVFAPVIRNS
jgi:hypothetical protein